MSTFIALLRGVNVGRSNRVPMAELRGLLSDLGYEGVSTLLNSGNAVFRARGGGPARHAQRIASAIAGTLELDIPVIVKSAAELARIVAENPLAERATDHSRLFVAFVQDAPALASLASIDSLVTPPDQFVMGKTAAYLHCPDGILKSKAGDALLGRTGRAATTRNWATVMKLQAMAGGRV